MKYILSLLICLLATVGCKEESIGNFIPFEEVAAFTYLESNEEFSEWAKLIRLAGLDASMNLKAVSLTCFVVKNDAVAAWLEESGHQTIEAMDPEEARNLLRYHIIQGKSYQFSEFKDGRFKDTTASGDYLTCLFVSGENSGVFVNGTARLENWDINVINGVIHVLEDVLTTVEGTMLDFIKQDQYAIFNAMIEKTSTGNLLEEMTIEPYGIRSRRAMLVIPDSIYKEAGIHNIDDLIDSVSFGQSSYTEESNPLNKYARYHMLLGNYTTSEFSTMLNTKYVDKDGGITLHTRVEEAVIHLQNDGGHLVFNPDAEGQAAELLGINYNLQTRNGMVHELNKVIYVTSPPPLNYVYDFADGVNNPTLTSLNGYRSEPVDLVHNLKKELLAPTITWQSSPQIKEDAVQYHISNEGSYNLRDYWKCDYDDAIAFNLGPVGWIEFQIPPIPKGTYNVILSFKKTKNTGGNFQIYLDGEKFGNVVEAYVPATASGSWPEDKIGIYTFDETSSHTFRCAIVKGGEIFLDVLILEPVI